MGSSAFAVPTLLKLIADPQFEVLEVYTKPPKPKGRGLLTSMTPTHSTALEYGLSVKTPFSLKGEELPPCDVIVVVSYGLIIPDKLLSHPKLAPLNIHPSLLPRWRGPSPIQYTILEGDKEAGVSIIRVTPELDAGAIYTQKAIPLDGTETYSTLHDQLANLGASMLHSVLKTLDIIKPAPQVEEKATYSKKLPNSVSIDFSEGIELFLRKLRVFGAVSIELFGKHVKIVEACRTTDSPITKVGVKTNSKKIFLQFKDGCAIVTTVKPENKKEMSTEDFLNGIRNKCEAHSNPHVSTDHGENL
ncbi:methionyl-tRNA formyltransferase [Neorickettsia risticii str. Illinois]|uniref:methionyl-tRNA formyltransferase n=1 Tax=Neorickettsia risticii (strain Illinois) TaxID=434131 RepID=C6V3X2_NEORI|nr:methionyl-tRNA formyltransferase [Neorickettsia risticii]ACT69099.1 methionyl-tRNA formyltransferase [Neorickettsia risticii str. Illinois]